MSQNVLLFEGSNSELWETDGTAAGTLEITPGFSANENGLLPRYIVAYDGEALFNGQDSRGAYGLWITNGTAAGTTEIGGLGSAAVANANPGGLYPGSLTVYNGEVLFQGDAGVSGDSVFGLWITNGTVAGTSEIGGAGNIGIANAFSGGLLPGDPDFTVFKGVALFRGRDAANNIGLWETNGTATGTFELAPVAGAAVVGTPGSDVQPQSMTVLGGEVLFDGADQQDTEGSLWETDGTAAGTVEIGGEGNAGISGSPNGFTGQFTSELPIGMQPQDLTTFGSNVLFAAYDSTLNSAGYYAHTDALWITDGTAGGTKEIGGPGNAGIFGIDPALDGGLFWGGSIEFPDFTVYGGEALFVGHDQNGHVGLWETDGTASGTKEVGGLGNAGISGGLSLNDTQSPYFTLYNGLVYFYGYNASNQVALWSTDGTAKGTHVVAPAAGTGVLTPATLGDSYIGGGQTIALAAGGSVSLWNTGANGDKVFGSGGQINLGYAQAKVVGGADTIVATGSGDVAKIFSTGSQFDKVFGSNLTGYVVSAEASFIGGGNSIRTSGSGDRLKLLSTGADLDKVFGPNVNASVANAEASFISGGDVIRASGAGDVVKLFATFGVFDKVYGTNLTAYLINAQASFTQGGDTIHLLNGQNDTVKLFATGANADSVLGSDSTIDVIGAQTAITGSSDTVALFGNDTVSLVGGSFHLLFQAAIGKDTINGFDPSDTLQFSAKDFANFAALQGHISQSGADAVITLDAADKVTLTNVTASSLSASEFRFA